ncbi:ras-related and estrogen-regulated growth inhibitor-like protein [Narcine bancroftii]|uniref:ras-related and estrogen-regulated growth inhibitor-like protein n=1 Tax=Narcine bancroftii TaxID=1343680 RepID=UPI0038321FD3
METVYTHNVTLDGTNTRFNIWVSLCPQPDSEAILHPTEEQMRWADGFIFVYSICDRGSFEVSLRQADRLRAARGDGRPAVLIGNKRDLSHRRTVSTQEGARAALAARCGFQVSAAEGYPGVLLAFHRLLRLIPQAKAAGRRGSGLRGLVRSVSATLSGRKRPDCPMAGSGAW